MLNSREGLWEREREQCLAAQGVQVKEEEVDP